MTYSNNALHAHSDYYPSGYDGVQTIFDYVNVAIEKGATAIALTDHGNCANLIDFYLYCIGKEAAHKHLPDGQHIKPILGVETYVKTPKGFFSEIVADSGSESANTESVSGNIGFDSLKDKFIRQHLILLCKDYQGFQAMSRYISECNKNVDEKGYPVGTEEMLAKYFGPGTDGYGHVVCSTACIGGVLAIPLSYNDKITKEIGKIERRVENSRNKLPDELNDAIARVHDFDEKIAEVAGKIEELKPKATKSFVATKRMIKKETDELELEAITANSAEYQKRAAESKEYLSNYVDSKYTDDNIRIAKKADINTYAENNAILEDAKAALSVYDKMIASLKKQISELENAITNAPKDATAEQLLGLKIALKGANSKLESYNKTLSDISNIRDTATKNIEALNLNKDDKEAAQQARTLLSNLTNPEEAKRFYENRRTAIDAELDYYRNGNGFEDIKDQIKLYEDEIKASTDKDLTDELNTYQTSEALQADESKFSDSDTRKAAYNAHLARLQRQESDTKAANARREAALKAEQERQARQQEERNALATEEDSNAAPIGSGTFGRSYREFEGIKPLSNEASSLYNALMSESQVTDSPLANVIENRRKSKSLTSKDAMLLEEIKEFNDATNRALDNSFDTLTTTNLKWIVTRIAAKYSIFDNIFFGTRHVAGLIRVFNS